jgi:hypothetical protein
LAQPFWIARVTRALVREDKRRRVLLLLGRKCRANEGAVEWVWQGGTTTREIREGVARRGKGTADG